MLSGRGGAQRRGGPGQAALETPPKHAWGGDAANSARSRPESSMEIRQRGNRIMEPVQPPAGRGQAFDKDVMRQNFFNETSTTPGASSSSASPPAENLLEIMDRGERAASALGASPPGPPRPVAASPMPPVVQEHTTDSEEKEIMGLLAHALRAKCGSLDRGFKWLDSNNNGSISGNEFSTGVGMLKLDPALKQHRPRKLFALIDKGKKNGIDLEAWRKFFEYVQDEGEQTGRQNASREGSHQEGASSRPENAEMVNLIAEALRSQCNGSLDEAFRRFNSSGNGKINLVQMSGAFASMSFEGPLKNLRPRKLFSMIETKTVGYIDLAAWRSFFGYDQPDDQPGQFSAAAGMLGDAGDDSGQSAEQQLASMLAVVLKEKCGTLDGAFRWFNSNHSGHITNMQWSSAFAVLKLPDTMKTMRARKLFSIISEDGGDITWANWRTFFDYNGDDKGRDFYDVKRGSLLGCMSGPITEHDYPALLAQCLREKCGSLERAYRAFDTNGSNDIDAREFAAGLKTLSLEGPLEEIKASVLFSMIDSDDTQHICMKNWRDFFGYKGEDDKGGQIASSNVSVWLAAVLREKYGFMDVAFRMLSSNKKSAKITSMQFNGGLGSVKFEGPLKGYRPRKLYAMIDTEGVGFITLEAWRKFFDYEFDDEPETPPEAEEAAEESNQYVRNVQELAATNDSAGTKKSEEINLAWLPYLIEALEKKCGSLDRAYQWIDSDRNGTISGIEWSSAYSVLQLEGPLKTMRAGKIFAAISRDVATQITPAAWRTFFGYEAELEEEPEIVFANPRAGSKPVSARPRSARPGSAKPPEEPMTSRPSSRTAMTSRPSSRAGEGREASPEVAPSPDDLLGAEAALLAEDLAQEGLTGKIALAYILAAKLRSLDGAFKWLDDNKTGNFSRSKWDSLDQLLHLDIEKLCGIAPRQIFKDMDRKNKKAVSKDDWKKYFEEVMKDPRFLALLEKLKNESLAERAAKKLGTTVEAEQPQSENTPPDSGANDKNKSVKEAKEAQDSKASKKSVKASSAKDAQAPKPAKDAPPPKPGQAVGIVMETEAPTFSPTPLKPPAPEPAPAAPAEPSEPPPVTEVHIDPSKRYEKSTTGIVNLEFKDTLKQRVSNQMRDLKPDESIALPASTTETELQEYRWQAIDRGYTVYDKFDMPGREEPVVILHEGPQAQHLTEAIMDLDIAESLDINALPNGPGMQVLVEKIAREQVFHIVKRDPKEVAERGGFLLQVWNLNGNLTEWYEGIKKRAKSFKEGEILDLPHVLPREKRDVTLQAAEELQESGFQAEVLGEGRGQYVSIGLLSAFWRRVFTSLSSLPPGGGHDFEVGMRLLERAVISNMAKDMRMKSVLVRDPTQGSQVYVRVTKPEEKAKKPKKDATIAKSSGEKIINIDDILSQLQGRQTSNKEALKKLWVQRLFDKYASGRRDGRPVFIRRQDVKKFTKEAGEMTRPLRREERENWKSAARMFDDLFEDTSDLQRLLGGGEKYGLSFRYFHVFIDKVAQTCGWDVVSQFVLVAPH